MWGTFSEESLKAFSELVNEALKKGGTLDFRRCVRADGTAYGTSGQCRKGTEKNKEVEAAKPKVSKTAKPVKGNAKVVEKVKISPETESSEDLLKKRAEAQAEEEEDFNKAQAKRNEGQIAANLSEKEKSTIFEYTTESEDDSPRSYRTVNECLRFPEACTEAKESQKFVKELDSALRKLPKNEDRSPFYRAVDADGEGMDELYETFEKAKPGTKVRDPGYGSYSAERGAVNSFIDGSERSIIFISRNKNLTPINQFSEWKNENESVLPRGTEQTIKKVTKEGNTLIVEFE